jgi:hypothetical protein
MFVSKTLLPTKVRFWRISGFRWKTVFALAWALIQFLCVVVKNLTPVLGILYVPQFLEHIIQNTCGIRFLISGNFKNLVLRLPWSSASPFNTTNNVFSVEASGLQFNIVKNLVPPQLLSSYLDFFFQTKTKPSVLRSFSVNFRPVDIIKNLVPPLKQ